MHVARTPALVVAVALRRRINLSNINRILRTNVSGHTVRHEKIHPRHEKRVFRPPFRAVWMTAPVELKFGADLTHSHRVLPRMSAFAAHQVTARLAARAVHRLVKVRSLPMTVHPGARPRPPHPQRKKTSAGSLFCSRFYLVDPIGSLTVRALTFSDTPSIHPSSYIYRTPASR